MDASSVSAGVTITEQVETIQLQVLTRMISLLEETPPIQFLGTGDDTISGGNGADTLTGGQAMTNSTLQPEAQQKLKWIK